MSGFKLQSEYQPTGDQPSAIAQLIEGLDKGERQQTLLGVTGSGKSVVGSTKVILDKAGRYYHVPIDTLDGAFSDLPKSVDETSTQYIPLEGELSTITLNVDTGETSLARIDEVSRHRYTGNLYNIETSAGHCNTFTDSHNVYALRKGEIHLLKSDDLLVGDFLPVPSQLPSGSDNLDAIDVTEWLPEDGFYVKLFDGQDVPKGILTPGKLWRVKNRSEGVTLKDYRKLRAVGMSSALSVGSNKNKADIPILLPINSDLLRFVGLFIAEGCITDEYIIVSTGDDTIVQEIVDGAAVFNLPVQKRQAKYDYQIGGMTISKLMAQWVGTGAKNKHLPAFWPQLSDSQLGVLLGGIFAGDGCTERLTVTLSSVSRELLTDVQLALTRFGIQARIRRKVVSYGDERRLAWNLSISGKSNLVAFQKYVGFGLERKDTLLDALTSKQAIENTNVDLMPIPIAEILLIMKEYGIYHRDVAERVGSTRSLVGMYLSGQRIPSRRKTQKMYEFFIEQARQREDTRASAEFTRLLSLSEVVWSPIKSISIEMSDTIVYDLSVPDTQTFLANGYFVHNTFSMANIIANRNVPTLVLAHNKTLAAQLYSEFKEFFPDNEVHYFVSYFDYYQPEAYIASSDTYIEKDSKINEEIDRLRHAATSALLTRRDTIIVASVSCIYGIGSPETYAEMSLKIQRGERRQQDKFIRLLTDIQYKRNDIDFARGNFRVKGDVVDVFPASSDRAIRLEFFGDEVDRITNFDPLTGEILNEPRDVTIFPSSHYATPKQRIDKAIINIEEEFNSRMEFLEKNNKLLEAQRLSQRTKYDLEMLRETGFVKGIENYSRYLTDREPGEQPATLIDYFPDDWLLLVDESHMTLPQVRGMYNGDRARKETLVEHGFRLPSALDNRPLRFDEFDKHINKAIYVSATPAEYELTQSPEPAQQVIRPTGLIDPEIEIRPIDGQIDDLMSEIDVRVKNNQRVLVTTLTKRMAEDLSAYLQENGVKTAYIHSEVDTLERGDILRQLREGEFDVLVGINLLREGLDLPEVSLVAIMDADKEGFLRSESALVQTIGRAARHLEGRVLMYADRITNSMQRAIDETNRRRGIQTAYNEEHNITPISIKKKIDEGLRAIIPQKDSDKRPKIDLKKIPKEEYGTLIKDLSAQMDFASANLEFEKAAELRDLIAGIREKI